MMNARRTALLLLLCAAASLPGSPARAQEKTYLKASYQGAFLPGGTAVVVLHRPATLREADLYQPEFFAPSAYPRDRDLLLRRDTLDARSQTRTAYPKTQGAGVVYFLYALAPDSTLYWSYSASVDSLKFDVVDRGVMAVAPIREARIRNQVLRTFFETEPPVEEPVAAEPPADTSAAKPLSVVDSLLAVTYGASADSAQRAVLDALVAVPVAEAPQGLTLSYGKAYGLGALLLALFATLLLVAVRAQRQASALRKERFEQRMQQMPTVLHPVRRAEPEGSPEAAERVRQAEAARAAAEAALRAAEGAREAAEFAREEAERALEQSEQDYTVLRARYNTLRSEVEGLLAERLAERDARG